MCKEEWPNAQHILLSIQPLKIGELVVRSQTSACKAGEHEGGGKYTKQPLRSRIIARARRNSSVANKAVSMSTNKTLSLPFLPAHLSWVFELFC